MSTRWLSQFLSVLFLALVVGVITFKSLTRPRVMVLHSYSTDYSWTNGVNEGLRRIMEQPSWRGYDVTWHYMDTKKRDDKRWLELAGERARQAIDQLEPDVLIAVDNLAQELAAKRYVDHPDISIVFAGINGPHEVFGYGEARNVTGIKELRQLGGLRETILTLEGRREESAGAEPRRARLLYVLDASKSVCGDKHVVDGHDWSPLEYVGSQAVEYWDDWKNVVLSSAGRTDYIFVTNYRQLRRTRPAGAERVEDPCEKHRRSEPAAPARPAAGTAGAGQAAVQEAFVPPDEVMGWTEACSPVPVLGLQVFNVEDGGMLAIGQSPYEQGEVAARMAYKVLNPGEQATDGPIQDWLPVVPNRHFLIAINEPAMVKRGLTLPNIYESFARSTRNYVETGDPARPGAATGDEWQCEPAGS